MSNKYIRKAELLRKIKSDSRFSDVKKEVFNDLAYLDLYKITNRHIIGDKDSISIVNINPVNISSQGLTKDLGIVNYLPTNDLYPNFLEETLKIIMKDKFEDIDKCKFINRRNIYTSQLKRSLKPLTINNKLKKEYKEGMNSSPLVESRDNNDNNVVRIKNTEFNIDIGVIGNIIYTTTSSIPMGFIDPVHTFNDMDIPCSGIIVDIITSILTINQDGHDDYGNRISDMVYARHLMQGDSNTRDTRLKLSNRVKMNRRKKYNLNVGERNISIVSEKYEIDSNIFPFIKPLTGNRDIILNVRKLHEENKSLDDSDKSLGDIINDNEFLPIGTIVPLFKIYESEGDYLALPLNGNMGKSFYVNKGEDQVEDMKEASILRTVLGSVYIEQARDNNDFKLNLKGKQDMYQEAHSYIIDELNKIMINI